jgi:hypothetical protein
MKRTHIRFDRHELFNQQDVSLVMELINQVPFEHQNSLFGLFDGYLYLDLLENVHPYLNEENYGKLENLVSKINNEVVIFDITKLEKIDDEIKEDLLNTSWRETKLECVTNVRDEHPWDENDKIEFYFVNDLYIIYDLELCEFYVQYMISDKTIIDEELL